MTEQNGFDDRLRKARAQHGMDPKPDGQGGLPQGSWGIGFRAGVELVSTLIVGAALGYFLDRLFGSFPWLFLVFFLVGGAAGVLNIYRLVQPRDGKK